jgi:hypothetical protein
VTASGERIAEVTTNWIDGDTVVTRVVIKELEYCSGGEWWVEWWKWATSGDNS